MKNNTQLFNCRKQASKSNVLDTYTGNWMGRHWISRIPPELIYIGKQTVMNFFFFFSSSLGKFRLMWNEVGAQFPFPHNYTINNAGLICPYFVHKSFIRWHTCAFSLGDWLPPPSLKAIPAEEIPWAEISGFLVNARGQHEQRWSWSDLWLGCWWTVWDKAGHPSSFGSKC